MNNELTLHFSDEAFEPVLTDADRTLQRLIANMIAKGSTEGTITIRVDIELIQEWIDNFDPSIRSDKRSVQIPKLAHKVSSMMQIKDEAKGRKTYDGYELVWDHERGEYVLRSIVSAQQSIFDSDFQTVPEERTDGKTDVQIVPEETVVPLLPGNVSPETVDRESVSPSEYLRRFIGEPMRVYEALGNYTVRTNRDGMACNTVVLSSAFDRPNPFYCSAETLSNHAGHAVECVSHKQGGTDGISIVCKNCGEVLYSVDDGKSGETEPDSDADGALDGDGSEPEDITDVFGGSPYEPAR